MWMMSSSRTPSAHYLLIAWRGIAVLQSYFPSFYLHAGKNLSDGIAFHLFLLEPCEAPTAAAASPSATRGRLSDWSFAG